MGVLGPMPRVQPGKELVLSTGPAAAAWGPGWPSLGPLPRHSSMRLVDPGALLRLTPLLLLLVVLLVFLDSTDTPLKFPHPLLLNTEELPTPPNPSATSTATPPDVHDQVRALLDRHVAFPGKATCGPWAETYAALHREIRSGTRPARYLTFVTTQGAGFGDRLNGIVAGFLAALLTDRAFIIASTGIVRAFEPAEIDWTPGPDVPMNVTANSFAEVTAGSVLRLHALNEDRGHFPNCPGCSGVPSDLLPSFSPGDAAANIIVDTQRGVLAEVFSHQDWSTYKALHRLGLRMPTAFGCLARFLLKPKASLVEETVPSASLLLRDRRGRGGVVAPWDSAGSTRICIHARTVDGLAWDKLGNGAPREGLLRNALGAADTLLHCAQAVAEYWVPAESNATWFIMSDVREVKQALADKILGPVVMSHVQPKHTKVDGDESFFSTAVDWLTFTLCNFYVINESGLSKTAFAYNLDAPSLYMFSRLDMGGVSGECKPSQPRDITSLNSWSGL